MGDGESSSSGERSRRGDTVVIDHGRRRSSCGYCRSTGYTSISHGLWAHSITAEDYQDLLDRGWRRSGSFIYKPDMEKTCCPSYTIRLKAGDFVHSKEQLRVRKKMQRFLDGTIDMKKPDQVKDPQKSSKSLFSLAGDTSLATVSALSAKESSAGMSEKICNEDAFIHYLSSKIDDSISAFVGSGEFPYTVQLPKASVKRVTPQAKKKLTKMSEDLLYTSNISFQIAAVLRHSQSSEKSVSQACLLPEAGLRGGSIVAEKLAFFMERHQEPSGLLIRACNGHLNFYSATKQASAMLVGTDACTKVLKGNGGNFKRSSTADSRTGLPQKKRKLEIRMKRSSFDPEEFSLYRKYQIKVHDDKPEKVTESSYRRFLVDTPIIFVPPCSGNKSAPSGFGSFHQQYVIDGKLVAVGVVDILPRCLSSKYLFWDPDLAFLSLGKYSALQEIDWVNETHALCPSLQYYYLGYYIHSCSKMRYKAAYRPSELLCPLRYRWVPFDIARPLLDEKSYVILSDCVVQQDQELSTQVLGNSFGQSDSHPNPCGLNDASSDDEDAGLEYGVLERWLDDESSPESCSTSVTDDLQAADISNIVIDLNGSRVKFKELQRVFGPIEKRHIDELEMQLHRYVRALGKQLSSRMVYSLG